MTRDLKLTTKQIETPLAPMDAPMLEGKKLVFASILRAGNGLLEGMLDLVPVGPRRPYRHLSRSARRSSRSSITSRRRKISPTAWSSSSIRCSRPPIRPSAAIEKLKERGARDIRFVCLLAAPEGIERFQRAQPGIPIFTAAIDDYLNDHGYIVPGLGDAGDRLYGTK